MNNTKFSTDEYTPEEIAKNGNGVYGGKRHDEILSYLSMHYSFSDEEINNISMGVWIAIQSEKAVSKNKISQLEKENADLKARLAHVEGELKEFE